MSVAFHIRIHSSSLRTVNIPLNIHSLDLSCFAGEELDLGGDDCEEAESESSAQLMSNHDTSDSGDIDSIGFLSSRGLGCEELQIRFKTQNITEFSALHCQHPAELAQKS